MASNFMVIKALKSDQGDRFPIAAGELKRIRFGYDNPAFVPRLVAQARAGEQIDWGGATVLEDGYTVLFDGSGPLPPEVQPAVPVNL